MRTILSKREFSLLDRHPAVDKLQHAYAQHGRDYKGVARKSNLYPTTVYNAFEGKTRSPHFRTMQKLALGVGLMFDLVKPTKTLLAEWNAFADAAYESRKKDARAKYRERMKAKTKPKNKKAKR